MDRKELSAKLQKMNIAVQDDKVKKSDIAAFLKTIAASPEQDFVEYCLSFYGKGGIYAQEFGKGKPFTSAEISKALAILKIVVVPDYDTVDRERVRDIVLELRKK